MVKFLWELDHFFVLSLRVSFIVINFLFFMPWSVKKRLLLFFVLLVFVQFFPWLLQVNEAYFNSYYRYIFQPIQASKSFLFEEVHWSVGDVLYAFFALVLIVAIVRFLSAIFSKQLKLLSSEAIRLATLAVLLYACFLISWGGNYERGPLYRQYVSLQNVSGKDTLVAKGWQVDTLDAFIQQLVTDINTLAADIDIAKVQSDDEMSIESEQLFGQFLNKQYLTSRLKPSLLGKSLQYLGIQGYFNPLSGEAQYSTAIHYSLRPFVFVHEMAHQVGIASETDANLLAYLLCEQSENKLMQYSAHLNLFMYAIADMRRLDRCRADALKSKLNLKTKQQLVEIEAIRDAYSNGFRKYSMNFYDGFLKHFGQKEGLRSYSRVAYKVYILQQQKINDCLLFSIL